MKILVTGGAGFVGSHTVDALLERGYEVRILDNLSKPVHMKGKPKYLPKEAEFMLGDVRNKDDWEKALEGVDVVYHFAAYQDYLPDFNTFFHVNAVGTALLYEVIVEKGMDIQKVIVASSQAVYGEGRYRCNHCGELIDPDPRSEEQLSLGIWDVLCPSCERPMEYLEPWEALSNPVNSYGISKVAEEQTALVLGYRYNIPSVALRYSIVQGPRQSFYNAYSGACRIFSLSLFLDRAPVIYEDGLQKRDFVNIEDVVAANLLVLDSDSAAYRAFNVGGGRAYTVLEFYEMAQRVFEKDIPPQIPGAFRVGDTRHAVSDISELQSLGWSPQYGPEKSLRDYRRYLEEQTDIEDILDYAEKHMASSGVVKVARPTRDRRLPPAAGRNWPSGRRVD